MLSAISRRLSAARSFGRHFGFDDRGSVVTFLVAMPVLAGVVAVGVETGQLYRVKRQMQISADAAALAASIDYAAGKTTATTTGQYEAQRNGFANGVNSVTVTVNTPPQSGAYQGNTAAAEVIIQKTQGFSLGAILFNMLNQQSRDNVTMRARAVAIQTTATTNTTTTTPITTSTTTANGCIIALTPNAEQGISITNMNNFGSDCAIISNGAATGTTSSTSALDMSSFNNVTMHNSANTAGIWTRGSFTNGGGIHFSADTQCGSNQAQPCTGTVNDPYSSLATPQPGSCTYTNYNDTTQKKPTLTPGTYCGTPGSPATPAMRVIYTNSNIDFMPGTYYIANGDMIISSGNNVTCSTCTSANGVTFVLTQTTGNNADVGGVSITAENNVSLNAGASTSTNTYPGVLFYQDRRATAGTMTSTSKIFTIASLNNATLTGAIYFPQNRIDISTINNILRNCSIWIGRYIKFSGYNNNHGGGCSTYGTTIGGITTTTKTNQTTTTTTTTTANKVVWDPT